MPSERCETCHRSYRTSYGSGERAVADTRTDELERQLREAVLDAIGSGQDIVRAVLGVLAVPDSRADEQIVAEALRTAPPWSGEDVTEWRARIAVAALRDAGRLREDDRG